jgi:hypothetical protein
MPRPTKQVSPYNRTDGTPVSGYTAKNPNFFKRQQVKITPRAARVYTNKDGVTIIDLPVSEFNQVASKVKEPRQALLDSGVQEWEIPEGTFLVGNTKNRTKVPVTLPRKTEE